MKKIKVLPLPPEYNQFMQKEIVKHNAKELSDFLNGYKHLQNGIIDINAAATEYGKIIALYPSIQNKFHQRTSLTIWFDCGKQQLEEFCIFAQLSIVGYYNILYSCLEANKKLKSEKL